MSNNHNKHNKRSEITLEDIQPNKEIKMDSKAYSIVYLNNKWNLVEFDFNKDLGIANEMKILETNNNRFEIEEQFKILMAEDLFQ